MLLDRRLVAGLAGLWTVSSVNAACSSNLVVDDFTKWTAGTNNLDWLNGGVSAFTLISDVSLHADRLPVDDGSMNGIAASNGQVVFIPKDGDSYFYEALGCQQPVTNGYGGIQFTVQGPAGGSFAVELQTTASCANDTSTRKSSYNIVSDLTGRQQTITIPLLGFDNEPNYDAIVALVWSSFSASNVQWSIGSISFVCGDVSAGQTSGMS